MSEEKKKSKSQKVLTTKRALGKIQDLQDLVVSPECNTEEQTKSSPETPTRSLYPKPDEDLTVTNLENAAEYGARDEELSKAFDDLKLGADAKSDSKKLLLLLDLSGTLVAKQQSKRYQRRLVKVKDNEFSHRNNTFHIRPYAKEFVCCLLEDKRVELGIYSSMMLKNIKEIIREFDKFYKQKVQNGEFEAFQTDDGKTFDTYSSFEESGVKIFDRDYNSKDPDGENVWDTVRDLEKIFKYYRNKPVVFNESNSLVIEAEKRKVRFMPNNYIMPPIYSWEDTKRNDRKPLKCSLKYINQLLKKMESEEEDVISFVQKHGNDPIKATF